MKYPSVRQYRDTARIRYGSDDFIVDSKAKVIPSEKGAFVACWQWINRNELEEKSDGK